MPATSNGGVAVGGILGSSQTPQKKASRIDMTTNTIWNAFNDILCDMDDVVVRH